MGKHNRKRSKKTGLPPGSLVHIGAQRTQATKVTVARYDENGCEEATLDSLDKFSPEKDSRFTWINVSGVHEPEVMKMVGDIFHIHPLTLEDIMNTDHITKLNDFDDYLFIVMKTFCEEAGHCGEMKQEQVSLLLGRNYLISFQESATGIFDPIRKRLRAEHATFTKIGPGYLAYCLMDIIIDIYFETLERIDDAIYELEEITTSQHNEESMKRIQSLRRETILVRRAAWPLREVINSLQRRENGLISEATRVYLSDIYDHVVQVIDTTETFREILSNIFDIYLTGISNRMNSVMKMLAIIATAIMPMTLITGLYGMNFENMPELKWRFGYPVALTAMAVIATTMILIFKKKKWI